MEVTKVTTCSIRISLFDLLRILKKEMPEIPVDEEGMPTDETPVSIHGDTYAGPFVITKALLVEWNTQITKALLVEWNTHD